MQGQILRYSNYVAPTPPEEDTLTYQGVIGDGNTMLWVDFTQEITSAGGRVSVWGDLTSNGNDLLQATGDNQPYLVASGIQFYGNAYTHYLKTAAFTLIQPEFIYMVVNLVQWSNSDGLFDGNADEGGLFYCHATTPHVQLAAGAGGPEAHVPINEFCILRVLINGASSKVIVNDGSGDGESVTGNAGTNNMGGFTLGRWGSTNSYHSVITVKEIIIRKVSDTSGNETLILDYLNDKYSIY